MSPNAEHDCRSFLVALHCCCCFVAVVGTSSLSYFQVVLWFLDDNANDFDGDADDDKNE